MLEIFVYTLTISIVILGSICLRLYKQFEVLRRSQANMRCDIEFIMNNYRERIKILEQKVDLMAQHCNVEFKRQPECLVIETKDNV